MIRIQLFKGGEITSIKIDTDVTISQINDLFGSPELRYMKVDESEPFMIVYGNEDEAVSFSEAT